LSRLIFFNTNKAPGKPLAPALDEFLRFILSREASRWRSSMARYIPCVRARRKMPVLYWTTER